MALSWAKKNNDLQEQISRRQGLRFVVRTATNLTLGVKIASLC